jgi:tetratricopeptide (TPR) repeat protein
MLNKPPPRPPVAVRPPVAITAPPQGKSRPRSEKAPKKAPKRAPRAPREPRRGPRAARGRALRGPAVGALVAALIVYLAFNAGGFFPGATAIAAIAVCALLVLGMTLAGRPFENFTPALAVSLALLAGFAIWTLASAAWSGADGRALFEFDRVLLYVLVLAFFGLLVPGRGRLEWGLRGFAAAAVAICAFAWTTRVAADVWPIAANIHPERLSFPITYWNSLGLLATLGILACIYLASGERQSRGWRVAGAAAVPLLASTLLLTFSRGSLAVAVLGLLVYVLLARPPRLLTTLGATALPAAVAMVASYQASVVSSGRFATAAGIAEGHDLALLVLACVAVAAVTRWFLLRVDDALDDWIPPIFEPRAVAAVVALVVVAAAAALLAFQVPEKVGGRYDSFVNGDVVANSDDPRGRLGAAGNNGRIMQAEVALEAFAEKPLQGTGAGTYELQWDQRRPEPFIVADAHNLYAEVLGELGIVGFLLLGGALTAIFAGLARRMRGDDRQLYAAVIALAAVWAVRAGIDWDWEMPAVTVWLFALAGLGLARQSAGSRDPRSRAGGVAARLGVVAAVCVVALVPVAIAVSWERLDTAVAEFDQGECEAAVSSARGSLDVLDVSPEPYEVLGYCYARLGQDLPAAEAMERAIERDPGNWEAHYGLALVRALAGADPMPELREARRLNPLEEKVNELIEAMRGRGPRLWESRAAEARLPL